MTSGHLILEATFGELEARLMARHPMSPAARSALRDRLFVVRLHTAPCVGLVPSAAGVAPLTYAALRSGLTKMLLQRRLAFHTLQHAASSSHAMYVDAICMILSLLRLVCTARCPPARLPACPRRLRGWGCRAVPQ